MLLIRHRINTLKELADVPKDMGVEVDLRSEGSDIILQHDPFKTGEKFEDYLKAFSHAMIILNVKTDGIEETVLQLLKKYKVENYFFLDLSFPTMVRMIRNHEKKIAVRFSEYEPLEVCLGLKGMVDWVWIDCFRELPLDDDSYPYLVESFKLCLVSPELQNHPKERIASFKHRLTEYRLDAVCTKHPELWTPEKSIKK